MKSTTTANQLVRTALLSLALGLSATVVPATSPSQGDKPSTPAAEQPEISPFARAARDKSKPATGKVYTNDDLTRLFGAEPAAPAEAEGSAAAAQPGEPTAPATGSTEEDPLAWLERQKDQRAERETNVAAAEKKVEQARQRIADLEKRILAIRNPLLARPEAPEEEREQWDQANGVERVERSQKELEQAREDLRLAEEELRQARGGS